MDTVTDELKQRQVEESLPPPPVIVIAPSKGWASLRLRELWAYRELLYFLAWRDVKVRYKQAALGVAWAIIQPLVAMVVFTVIFGHLAKLPSIGSPASPVPYALMTFSALLPWQLFAGALTRAGASLVGNANLLTKVYFPRLIIPVSAVASGLVDFALSFLVLIGLVIWYARTSTWAFTPTWALATLPLFALFAVVAALAVGLWTSALNVEYRDVGHVLPFLVQVWMYASPVAYAATLVPSGPWRIVYSLNPMVSVIQGFQWALFGIQPPDGMAAMTAASAGVVIFLFVTGLWNFKRMERTFADVV